MIDENVEYFRGPGNIFVGRPTKIRKLFSSAGPRKYGSYFRRPRDRQKCGVFSWAGAIPTKISHWPTTIFVGLSEADENRGPKSSRSRARNFSLARLAILNHRVAARRRAARTPLAVLASSPCPIAAPPLVVPHRRAWPSSCPIGAPVRPSPCPPPCCDPSSCRARLLAVPHHRELASSASSPVTRYLLGLFYFH
jgi:hypothetical protein